MPDDRGLYSLGLLRTSGMAKSTELACHSRADLHDDAMKILFFMGRNPDNKSGLSWKMWKVRRTGRSVTTWWGRAVVKARKVVPAGVRLQEKKRTFRSVAEAVAHEERVVREKLAKGYQRRTRWRE